MWSRTRYQMSFSISCVVTRKITVFDAVLFVILLILNDFLENIWISCKLQSQTTISYNRMRLLLSTVRAEGFAIRRKFSQMNVLVFHTCFVNWVVERKSNGRYYSINYCVTFSASQNANLSKSFQWIVFLFVFEKTSIGNLITIRIFWIYFLRFRAT